MSSRRHCRGSVGKVWSFGVPRFLTDYEHVTLPCSIPQKARTVMHSNTHRVPHKHWQITSLSFGVFKMLTCGMAQHTTSSGQAHRFLWCSRPHSWSWKAFRLFCWSIRCLGTFGPISPLKLATFGSSGAPFFRETNLGHHWKFTAITSLRIFWDHLGPARFSANLPVTGCIRSLFLKRRQGKNASINHGEPKSCPWASKFPSSGLAPLYKQ